MDILEFLFPFCQTINLCGIDANSSSFNVYAEIINAPLMGEALPQFQEEVLLVDEIKYFVNDLFMKLFIVIHGNEDIIHVNKDAARVFVLDFGEYSIHGSLKDCRGV